MIKTEWLPGRNIFRGVSRVTGDDDYVVMIATNGYKPGNARADDPDTSVHFENVDDGLTRLTIKRDENGIVEWIVKFSQ